MPILSIQKQEYYESAKKRNIKYMYFVKLIFNKEIIGALLV